MAEPSGKPGCLFKDLVYPIHVAAELGAAWRLVFFANARKDR